jgi:hypothetical protein
MDLPDPFSGVWELDPSRSRLTGSPPRLWVQTIAATRETVHVSEQIILADGTKIEFSFDAGFDGADYPIAGSPVADAITYKRLDQFRIAGTARKDGRVSMTDVLQVSPDGKTLTMTYVIGGGSGFGTSSMAVFKRSRASR